MIIMFILKKMCFCLALFGNGSGSCPKLSDLKVNRFPKNNANDHWMEYRVEYPGDGRFKMIDPLLASFVYPLVH